MKEEGRRREEGGRGRGKREEAGEVGEKKEGGRREGEAGSNFFFTKPTYLDSASNSLELE